MTRSQVVRVLKQVRYKPGWKFRLDHADDIEIIANVPDAYHPRRKPIDPPHAYVTNPDLCDNVAMLLGRLFDACQRLEFHECAEWFKYRGRRPFDQHR